MKRELISILEDEVSEIDIDELKYEQNKTITSILNKLFENVTTISKYEIYEFSKNKKIIEIIEDYIIKNDIYYINDDLNDYKSCFDQYLEEMGRFPLLTVEEEKELMRKAKNGDKSAREKVINSNLRLVVNIVKKYYYRDDNILDLIQEGNTGLLKAYDKFDPNLGFKFSTYATNWIKLYISRYFMNKSRNIHIPEGQLKSIKKIIEIRKDYFTKYGKMIENEELAKLTGLSIERIIELGQIPIRYVSIYKPITDEDSIPIIDLVKDDNNNPEELALNEKFGDEVKKIIDNFLTPREKEVIYERYGIKDGIYKTQEEVSEIFGITRSRVGQIEKRAFSKMRDKQKVKSLMV